MVNREIHEGGIRQDSPLLDMPSSKLSLVDSPNECQGELEDMKGELMSVGWFSTYTRLD
jgi:hypothetical protein